MLEGVPFHEIHNYSGGTINGVNVSQPKRCGRCEVTGIDQENGVVSKVKPLAGIVKLGGGTWIDKAGQKQIIMGENWLPKGEVIVQKGDIFKFTDLRVES